MARKASIKTGQTTKAKPDRRTTRPAISSKATKLKAARKEAPSKGRTDSKKGIILTLLRRKNGASVAELSAATGWQEHSVRGFLSGTIKKKLGLPLENEKAAGGDRRYFLRGRA